MSFLLPSLRHTFRNSLRTSPKIFRPQNIFPVLSPFRQQLTLFPRSYSQKNGRKQPSSPPKPNNSQAPQSESLDSVKQSSQNPPSTGESSVPPESKAPKDPLTGDIQAAPGSILSEYTIAPAGSGKLEAASDSASSQPPKREQYISSADRKRERIAKFFTWGFLLGIFGGSLYLGRPLEKEEEERMGWGDVPSGHSPLAYWKRFQRRGKFMLDYFSEPAFEKILPPPAPEPYRRPYTLLLDLDDLLVHSEWTREHGWRTAKRPGLDYFLGYLSSYYEIVIFTTQYAAFAFPLVNKLDPYHVCLSGAIFRESTRYLDGKVVKDLSYLNRDLDKVILIDTNPDSCRLQPENALIVEKWKGEPGDKGLIALIPFLEYLASQNFKDFRPILTDYKESAAKRNVPVAEEFARREAIARKALQETLKPAPAASPGPSFISRLFGLKSPIPVPTPPPQPGDIVTPLDLMRQQATESYEAMKKYIDEHGAEILEEDKKREQQILGEQKMSLVDFMARFGGGGAPPPVSSQDSSK